MNDNRHTPRPKALRHVTDHEVKHLAWEREKLNRAQGDFVDAIVQLLNDRVSADSIAQALGVQRTTLYRWVRGESRPRR